ncbi:MAG: hypothetical protein ACHQF0_13320, partial [Chitinophagales bacterium]
MGFELNSEAYILFAKIEVGLREFLIKVVKEKGVNQWTKSFLGKIHLESIKEIGKRIYETSEKQQKPNIEDIYLTKIHRELKSRQENFKKSILLHPFYYLNWSEFIGVVSKHQNFDTISNLIGKLNTDILIHNLEALNFLRTDVAHSRLISEADLVFIKSAYDQISTAIPGFYSLFQSQYQEETISSLLDTLLKKINEIENCDMATISSINEIEGLCIKIIDSFWINSLFIEIQELVKQLNEQII